MFEHYSVADLFANLYKKRKTTALELPLAFEQGAAVINVSTKNEGILLEQTRKGTWLVQFGSLKMSMKEKDLKLVRKTDSAAATPDISIELADDNKNGFTERPVFELKLLGMHSDEAVRAMEHQLDLCVLNNFLHFSIIHGKGDGILQQTVADFLSHNPVVADFCYAPAEDGGAGKTYVTLK